MNIPQEKTADSELLANRDKLGHEAPGLSPTAQFKDNRPQASAHNDLRTLIAQSQMTRNTAQLMSTINDGVHRKALSVQRKENKTGLPDNLKSGVESLSGMSMDHVRVHYNSSQPAQLNAHAYAQGGEIHVAPGQEMHLPHEAWHVVQQAQGRVQPTRQMKGEISVNDDAGLEHEADVMGSRAAAYHGTGAHAPAQLVTVRNQEVASIQRMLVGIEMETKVPIYENGERPDHVDGYAHQANEYDHANVDELLRKPLGSGFELHVDSGSAAPAGALRLLNPGATMHIMEIVSKPVSSRAALLSKLKSARNFLKVIEDYSEVTGENYSIGWPIPAAPFALDEEQEPFPTERLEEVFSRDYESGKGVLYDVASQVTFQVPPDHLSEINDRDTMIYDTGKKKNEPRTTKMVVTNKETGKKERQEVTTMVQRPITAEHPIVTRDSMAQAMFLSDDLRNPYIRRLVDITVKIFKDALRLLGGEITGTVKNSVQYLVRSDLGKLFPDFPLELAEKMGKDVFTILSLTKISELGIPPQVLKNIYDAKTDSLIVNPRTVVSLTTPPEREEGELEHLDRGLHLSLKNSTTHGGSRWPWQAAMQWLGEQVGTAIAAQGSADTTGPLHGSQNLGLLPEKDPRSELAELSELEQATGRWGDDPEHMPFPEQVVRPQEHRHAPLQPSVVLEDRAAISMNIREDTLPDAVEERLNEMNFPDNDM